MQWIQPESYIEDGDKCLTFVSSNQGLFTAVHKGANDRVHLSLRLERQRAS